MPGSTGPNLGIVYGYADHEDNWGQPGYNASFAKLDAIVQLAVIGTLTAAPGAPVAGDRYIVGPGATGAWAAHDDAIAVWETIGSSAWVFYDAPVGWHAWHIADNLWKRYDGADWLDEDPASALDDAFDLSTPINNDVLVYDTVAGKGIYVRPKHTIGFGCDPTALLTADQEVLYYKFPVGVTFVDNFGDYRDWSTVAQGTAIATADVVLVVEKAVAATPLTFAAEGTLTIAAAGAVLTAKNTTGGDLVFAKNDVIRILAPTSPDATFKGLFGTLVGYET